MKYSIYKPEETEYELEELPEILQKLLLKRGITKKEEADTFLSPDFEKNYDPYLMKDMEKAVERVITAIQSKEKVVIYSDFDADGIPGGALLADFFKLIGFENFSNYIPHRHDEGYGFHLEAVEEFAKDDTDLIITVDVGIADTDQVKKVNELGMDVIITDHHEPNGHLPEAYAILNPKQKDCKYPFKELCGSGVAYKLVQGILEKNRFNLKEGQEKWLLDLVGLATLSDMVSLVDENRIFAYYGMKVLQKTRRPGLLHLFRNLRINSKTLSEDDLTFMITPRINAASRMGHPMDGFQLLTEKDESKAGPIAKHLDEINNERKGVVASIVKEIKSKIDVEIPEILVFGNPKWKPALLGLVANTLAEDYKRPVFLWGRENGDGLKGSARSYGGLNLLDLMNSTKDVFVQFGGHKMAGGFCISHDRVHNLKEKLIESYKKIKKEDFEENLEVDHVLSMDDVTEELHKILDKLSPFGVGNPKPTFLFQDLEISDLKTFGKQKNHLKLVFNKENGGKVEAISFFTKPDSFEKELEVGQKINLVANLEKSFFMNSPVLRLRIVDIF